MKQIFEQLQKMGKNTIGEIINWLKNANVIDATKKAEDNARQLLGGGDNQMKVTLEKFKEALQKLASEQKKNFEDLCKNLTSVEGGKFMGKLMEGASSLKDKFLK